LWLFLSHVIWEITLLGLVDQRGDRYEKA
jgi:hypothetical protein